MLRNATDRGRYERKRQKYGQYSIRLVARNHRVIATGVELYTAQEHAKQIDNLVHWSLHLRGAASIAIAEV